MLDLLSCFFARQFSVMIEAYWINFGYWRVLVFFTGVPWSQACFSESSIYKFGVLLFWMYIKCFTKTKHFTISRPFSVNSYDCHNRKAKCRKLYQLPFLFSIPLLDTPISSETCNRQSSLNTHHRKITDSMMIYRNQGDWKNSYKAMETY